MPPSGWAWGPQCKSDDERGRRRLAPRNYSRASPGRDLNWAKPANRSLSPDPQVTQDDDREIKGWARSIDSLFAEVEAEEVMEDQAASPGESELEAEAPAPEPEVETEELATVPEIEPEAVSEAEPRSSVELQLEEATSR